MTDKNTTIIENKVNSFINLVKRDCVSQVVLKTEFVHFMSSGFSDAYEYFAHHGYIRNENIPRIEVIKLINVAMRKFQYEVFDSVTISKIIGETMKLSNGKLNPNDVKAILEDYLL